MSKKFPRHIAVIMDGNSRWSIKNNLPKKIGYEKGIDSLERLLRVCIKLKIKILTVYALSTENANRKNVKELHSLIRYYIKNQYDKNKFKEIDFRLIGDKSGIQKDILTFFNKIEKRKLKRKKIIFNLAYNYGSWNELSNCINNIFYKKQKNANYKINEINIKKNLYTKYLPDPDILIRTGGNLRLSNFMLLQLKYTELFFLDTLWPDFNENHLINILNEFSNRKRTFGL